MLESHPSSTISSTLSSPSVSPIKPSFLEVRPDSPEVTKSNDQDLNKSSSVTSQNIVSDEKQVTLGSHDSISGSSPTASANVLPHRKFSEPDQPDESFNLPSPKSPEPHQDHDLTKRQKIIDEIVATELTYKSHLATVIAEFIAPLRQAAANKTIAITEVHIRAIFSNIEVIHSLHETLAKMLQEDPDSVAAVFERFGAFLKIYTEYVNSYDKSNSELETLKKTNKKFRNFLQSKSGKGFMDIRSYLITPIQRIPRYILLLKELLKQTPQDHEQRKSLERSFEKIQDIADFVNDAKRKLEDVGRVMELQAHIMEDFSELVIPTRRLLKEGTFVRKTHGKVIHSKTNVFFLFNDLILWTTEGLKYKGRMPLLSITEMGEVDEKESSSKLNLIKKASDTNEEKPCLVIKARSGQEEHTLDIQFPTEADREEWHKLIEDAIFQLTERIAKRGHAREGSFSQSELSMSIGKGSTMDSLASENF
eukprot:TRINITY_DN1530_c0_g1_i5.p2 TRINITY_DN1530_c0_g1~~TRINITY_DN1530_c0_g1_i5.p2  ORF type:complete len:479 (+),score=123.00 TRINITY_DN1530_c0_g1_i5:317-1753(+)